MYQRPRKLAEKVGRWALVEGRSLGRGLNPFPVLRIRGVTPGNFLKNRCKSVQFGDIGSSKVGRKIDVFPSLLYRFHGS